MAAVLTCGPHAVLSHLSGGQLWRILRAKPDNEREQDQPVAVDVSVPATRSHRRTGIRIHRRADLQQTDCAICERIPVTTPGRTLLDLASVLPVQELVAAVNEADKLGRIDPESLRRELDDHQGATGAPTLRRVLDRHTFAFTESDLERRFLRLIRKARLPVPQTQQKLLGFRVDFIWPAVRLVVETDGLRYHRTPAQQARDRQRDQALFIAGFNVLRFTHAQVRYEPERVVAILRSVLVGS
jgi:very-short-patch-repair endonuclease